MSYPTGLTYDEISELVGLQFGSLYVTSQYMGHVEWAAVEDLSGTWVWSFWLGRFSLRPTIENTNTVLEKLRLVTSKRVP